MEGVITDNRLLQYLSSLPKHWYMGITPQIDFGPRPESLTINSTFFLIMGLFFADISSGTVAWCIFHISFTVGGVVSAIQN